MVNASAGSQDDVGQTLATIHTESGTSLLALVEVSPVLSSFTVLVTAATGYRGFQFKPDLPLEEITVKAKQQLEAAATKPFATLYTRHREDYQRLFRRVSLSLGARDNAKPTDRRVKEFGASPDPSLALYFQYGRYLRWAAGRLVDCTIRPDVTGSHRLRPPQGQTIATIRREGRPVSLSTRPDRSCLTEMEAGRTYRLSFSA